MQVVETKLKESGHDYPQNKANDSEEGLNSLSSQPSKNLEVQRSDLQDVYSRRNRSTRCSIKMRTSLVDDLHQLMPRVVTLERNEQGQIKYNLKVPAGELVSSNQFEFVSPISSGGFGVVNLCKSNNLGDLPNGKEIAVKLFTRGGSGGNKQLSNERLKSIESELNYVRIFKHPNIVEYYGILNPSTGQIGFAMEYLDGGTVFEVLYSDNNVIPLEIRKMWCVQLIQAAAYLHEGCAPYRFIHRDIKTINLLINRKDLSIRLCDFGNVRERTFSYYRLDNNGGSVRYISPESLRVGSFINDKADIWSIGCCIIEIFGGGIPYSKFSDESTLISTIREGTPPEIPSFFPSNLKKICSKCLSSDPNLRPTSQQLLRDILALDIEVLRKSKLEKLDKCSKVY
ncbi:Ser/Thr protein kinase [Cryptosporidium canis]|uniref:Ser/Thr protein kinase n=1 Tax=Cryptosporidium canis TaxID=195482 RepID=A0ABQ8PBJ4_9CRYT|nr:Ser/Thr protein kinase [Cryptosporidium canis]KAJ1615337.1 Ser/Thr protein kinase [Cryptosporidium canis]